MELLISERTLNYFKLTKIITIGVRTLGLTTPKTISKGNGRVSPGGNASNSQDNLLDYFDSAQLVEKVKETPSSKNSSSIQDEGEADRKQFSKEKRSIPAKSNLVTVTSGMERGT